MAQGRDSNKEEGMMGSDSVDDDGSDHMKFWHDRRVTNLTSINRIDHFGVSSQKMTYQGLPG